MTKTNSSNNVVTKAEMYTAVLDWIQATEEFHRHHKRIKDILQEKNRKEKLSPSRSARHSQVNNLGKLHQHMSNVLETLLGDMDRPTGGSACNHVAKAGRLITHARLLKEINQKIGQELLVFTTCQA